MPDADMGAIWSIFCDKAVKYLLWTRTGMPSSMFVNSQLRSKPGYRQRIFRLGSLSGCLFRMHLPMSCYAIPYFTLPEMRITSGGCCPSCGVFSSLAECSFAAWVHGSE